jgi:hypothetical protein
MTVRPRRQFHVWADLIAADDVDRLDVGLPLTHAVGDFLQVQIIVQHPLLLEGAVAIAALLERPRIPPRAICPLALLEPLFDLRERLEGLTLDHWGFAERVL